MKVCSVCGAKYTDRISFCFNDGAVLEARVAPSVVESALDAPAPAGPVAAPRRSRGRSLLGERGGGAFDAPPLPSPFDPPQSRLDAPRSSLDAPPAPSAFDAPGPGSLDAPAVAGVAAAAVPEPDFQLADLRPLPLKAAPWKPPRPPEPAPVAEVQRPAPPPPEAPPAPAPAPLRAPPPGAPAAAPAHDAAPDDDFFDGGPTLDIPDDDEPERAGGLPMWLLPAVGAGVVGVLLLGGLLVIGGVIGGTAISKGSQPSGGATTAGADPVTAAGADPVTAAGAGEPVAAVPAEPDEPAPLPGSDEAPVDTTDAVADVEPTGAVPVAPSEPTATERAPEPVATTTQAAPTTAAASTLAPARPGVEPEAPVADPVGTADDPWGAAKQPTSASVQIVSVPAGATITVDGAVRGETPLSIELPFGAHVFALELEGYEPARKTVDVRTEGLKVPIDLQRKAKTGAVMVFMAGRDGDTLLINGEVAGALPVRKTMGEGEHVFTVEGANGRFQVSREVVFNANGSAMLNLAAP